jgi:hypothetical protein
VSVSDIASEARAVAKTKLRRAGGRTKQLEVMKVLQMAIVAAKKL